jgi:hypothetical protein
MEATVSPPFQGFVIHLRRVPQDFVLGCRSAAFQALNSAQASSRPVLALMALAVPRPVSSGCIFAADWRGMADHRRA